VRRREFLAALGAAAAWPVAARAQQDAPRRIAVLGAVAANRVMGPAYQAFLDELRRAGFSQGQNLVVDHRPSDQDTTQVRDWAVEAARVNPDALVALGSESTLQAFVRASQALPIVFVANNYDPIARGYVHSLARPGGNITGVFLRQTELAEKQVELLTQAFPDRKRLAVLWDAVSADQFVTAEQRARLLHLEVYSRKMENPPYDFDTAFRAITDAGADMLLVLSSQFFAQRSDHLVELAVRHRLPSMFIFKAYVAAGGLMSYGADNIAMYRQGATFVGKILKGTKPADLPVEQPTKYEMAVNLNTAKAIGIELPTSILLRADEVIEQ
jgi:putative tryptophan/tyrosine transport system substrate-binding protein